MNKYLLFLAFIPVVLCAEKWDRFKLHYTQPAQHWESEALPVGNGRLGAMTFGGIETARIQLSEESIWAGPPVPEPNPKLKGALPKAREAWFAGDIGKAGQLLKKRYGAAHFTAFASDLGRAFPSL